MIIIAVFLIGCVAGMLASYMENRSVINKLESNTLERARSFSETTTDDDYYNGVVTGLETAINYIRTGDDEIR